MNNNQNQNQNQNPNPNPQAQNYGKRPADINVVTIMGNLTSAATFKAATQEGGQAKAYFTVASNEGWTRADGTEAVSFISCQISGKFAEAMAKHLTQGTGIVATGRLRTWSTKDPAGQYENNYIVSIEDMKLTHRPQRNAPEPPAQQPQQAPQYQQAPAQAPAAPQYQPQQYQQAPAQQPQYQPQPQQAPQYQQAPAQAPAAPQYQPQQYQQAPAQQPQYQPQPQQAPQYQQAPAAPAQDAPPFTYSDNPFDMGGGMDSARFSME